MCGWDCPGARGSKMSRTGPKGLNVVSNWTFCAESGNQRLTCRSCEVSRTARHADDNIPRPRRKRISLNGGIFERRKK